MSTPSPLRGGDVYCPYAYGCESLVVPADSFFVTGDHRNDAQDLRYRGFVKRDKIKGRAVTVHAMCGKHGHTSQAWEGRT